jgi:cysteine-rich repeat protein
MHLVRLAASVSFLILSMGPARAGAPAALGPERLVDRVPDRPSCGDSAAPLRLISRWNSSSEDYASVLQRPDADGTWVDTAEFGLPERSDGGTLVCRDDGTGAVVIGHGWPIGKFLVQPIDGDGKLVGTARDYTLWGACDTPSSWILTATGDVFGAATCAVTSETRAVVLRRFLAANEAELPPVIVRDESAKWVVHADLAEDLAGNVLVAWSEYDWYEDSQSYESRVFVRPIRPNGKVFAQPVQMDTFVPAHAWFGRIANDEPGIFTAYWQNRFEGNIARTLTIDSDLYAASPTTTTTTLPPSAEAPVFDLVRTVGQTSAPPPAAAVAEGSLAGLRGGGDGSLLLSRSLQRFRRYDFDSEWALPGVTTYLSSNAGRTWKPLVIPVLPSLQEVTRWEAVSTDGTLLSVQTVVVLHDDEEWWGHELRLVSRRSTDGGRSWSDDAIVASLYSGYPFLDLHLASGDDGRWLVALVTATERNGSGYDVQIDAIRSSDDGKSWQHRVGVWSYETERDCCNGADAYRARVSLAPAPDGGWAMAWRTRHDGGLWAAFASDDASAWSVRQIRPPSADPENIGPNVWSPDGPYEPASLAVTPSGKWIVAWSGYLAPLGSDGDILFATSDDNGQTWDDAAPLNVYASIDRAWDSAPSLAADETGRVLAVWSTHDSLGGTIGFDSDIVTSITTDGGITWSPPVPVDAAAGGDARRDEAPMVAAGGGSRWSVAWTSLPFSDAYIPEPGDTIVKVAIAGSTCGDGVTDRGEDCDDGNAIDLDGCNGNCTLPGCGNEVAEAGEVCEADGVDPGCVAGCTFAVCGDGDRNVWTEECDDGNGVDTDECPSTCVHAWCGDGFTRETWYEECDDANTVDTDGCRNGCVLSRCGDGVIESAVETCDDGDAWGGNACTDQCQPATCGDGRVWLGVEQCDDPDGRLYHGKCSPDCQMLEPCSDADGNGLTTSSDALKILRYAIDLERFCTPDRCDLNGNGRVTAIDATVALHQAAGFDVVLRCPVPGTASFIYDDSRPVSALLFKVDYSETNIGFGKGDGKSDCEPRMTDTMFASNLDSATMTIGVVSLREFRGPVEIARCNVYAKRGEPADSRRLQISVFEAADKDGEPLSPTPQVAMISN